MGQGVGRGTFGLHVHFPVPGPVPGPAPIHGTVQCEQAKSYRGAPYMCQLCTEMVWKHHCPFSVHNVLVCDLVLFLLIDRYTISSSM